LNELINIFQNFSNDPSFNVHQTGFGSYIANHVIKEKIQRYNNEAMIPPKRGDVWIPKIVIAIGKESHHAMLDLVSSLNILSKELYDLLDLDKKLEKRDIDLLLADDSTKYALGRINDVMIEFHMTFFRALGSLVVLSFPQPLSFSLVLPKPLSKTLTRSSDGRNPVKLTVGWC
jgi:hypothetical protein